MQTYAHRHEFEKMRMIGLLGPVMFALKNILIMTIIVSVGPKAVSSILAVIPKWVTNGLNIAGGMLPVLGIALLMHYMPVKKYIWAVFIGFVFSAYLKLPIIGISILGAAASIIVYKVGLKNSEAKAAVTQDNVKETGDDDYDE